MATTWTKAQGSNRSTVSTQTTTESAPTGITEGFDLNSVGGFSIFVACDSGQSFSSAVVEAFRAYRFSQLTQRWSRSPEHDLDIVTDHVGARDICFDAWTVSNPRGRIAHVANAVLVTGGALTITYEATKLSGEET
jgi:hypothetical protein